MKMPWLLTGLVLTLAGAAMAAPTQGYSRAPGEADLAFAKRALRIADSADPHTVSAPWNGVPTLFVDFETGGEPLERRLVALQQQPGGEYRDIRVTVAEEEGGIPEILAIGFANADRDPAKELIVILTWPQLHHYDYGGAFYEVRFFDTPKVGERALAPLRLGARFEIGCECSWRDGRSERFRFKTIAEVKSELKRMGY